MALATAVIKEAGISSEVKFLEENEVVVTNSRFIVPSQVFAMSGVTSVKFLENQPNRVLPSLLCIAGLILMLATYGTKESPITGLGCLVIGIWWFIKQGSAFYVVLNTSSGEAKALMSKDGKWIRKVIDALNESIIYRN